MFAKPHESREELQVTGCGRRTIAGGNASRMNAATSVGQERRLLGKAEEREAGGGNGSLVVAMSHGRSSDSQSLLATSRIGQDLRYQ